MTVGTLLILISLGAISGERHEQPNGATVQLESRVPRTWVPWLLARSGYHPFANLDNADVSVKPPNWTGKKDEELDLVKGADLVKADLRNAHANSAFFVKANLAGAFMESAILDDADLRQANLESAHLNTAHMHQILLQDANMNGADLRGASLPFARLNRAQMIAAQLQFTQLTLAELANAKLTVANLTNATLRESNLENADLVDANLQHAALAGANLTGVQFVGANLKYADFRGGFNLNKGKKVRTRGLTKKMLDKAQNWQLAFYDPKMLKQLGLPPDHNEKLQKQMEAEQQQAKSAATTPPTPK